MEAQTEKRYYTLEEYLELEKNAEYKNEYLDGEIISMAGETTNHNQIAGNFYKRFPLNINNQDYYIYIEGVRLWLPQHRFYTYPDIMVIKGQPVYQKEGKLNITNPQIIVEVLSQSTQGYDRRDKFRYYRSLPTFVEYILIEQYSYVVEQYLRQSEDKWSLSFCEGKNAILSLASVDWSISLEELYQRVDFEVVG